MEVKEVFSVLSEDKKAIWESSEKFIEELERSGWNE